MNPLFAFFLTAGVLAAATAHAQTPSELIDEMRHVADAAQADAGSDQAAAAIDAQLDQAEAILNAASTAVASSDADTDASAPVCTADSPDRLFVLATVTQRPSVDCKAVVAGYAKAKAYWRELIALTRRIAAERARTNRDAARISRDVDRVVQVKKLIDAAFPPAWDVRDQSFIQTWKPDQGDVTAVSTDGLDWHSAAWTVGDMPAPFSFTVKDGAFVAEELLSTTSYCLEPRLAFWHGTITSDAAHLIDVVLVD